jgi:hypothetical protein
MMMPVAPSIRNVFKWRTNRIVAFDGAVVPSRTARSAHTLARHHGTNISKIKVDQARIFMRSEANGLQSTSSAF